MPTDPIDPLNRPRYALEGRVVTMDASSTVLDRGTVYIDAGCIASVRSTGAPPPGYEDVPVIRTGGTIYPGLIELHNHLSYNILRLWNVPRRYTNRAQWSGTTAYRKHISGPMQVLGRMPHYVAALVRYVECKCLLSGVTTSQGIALYSNQGISRYYRGSVRNVEQTDDAALPEAATKIADVEAVDAGRFLARLQRSSCLLLHLSEGIDQQAHDAFSALRLPNNTWAITSALAGIHCIALNLQDYQTLRDHDAAMVWSPLSNLLLYGQTADVKAAKEHGVRIGIGSDWSTSGSKNLLGELKVARLVSAAQGDVFTDREVLAMATRNAAAILKWDQVLGSIEAGKRADLLIVAGRRGDPYATLLEGRETGIILVVIDGVPRYGRTSLMQHFGSGMERWQVGGAERMLNLAEAVVDPAVGALSLSEARDRLRDGLHRLPELARELERPQPPLLRAAAESQWFLRLDETEPEGVTLRPYVSTGSPGLAATRSLTTALAAVPLPEILEPLDLDSLTVADDQTYLDRLIAQPNLPDYVKAGLPALY